MLKTVVLTPNAQDAQCTQIPLFTPYAQREGTLWCWKVCHPSVSLGRNLIDAIR